MKSNSVNDFKLADRIAEGLVRCTGKQKAACNKLIRMRLKKEGLIISAVKVREIIHYLRTERKMFICGDNNGYYVPVNDDERRHQINSMTSRIREITEARDAMIESHRCKIVQAEFFN